MANKGVGTNYYTDNGDTGVQTSMIDGDGYALDVKCTTANIPSAKANYQIGCVLHNITTGSVFINQGTTASCSFRDVTY